MALASIALAYSVIAWVCILLITLLPHRCNPQTHPQVYARGLPGRAFEPVELTCRDGVRLDACFLPATSRGPTGRPASLIMLHGISDCKERLLSGAAEMADLGYDVLLLDFRGHGRSEGRLCSYGYHERLDVRAGVDWLERRCPGPIAVYGLSLGGAVAFLAADADPRIAAVVSEGAYARLREVISDYAARKGALRIIQPPALFWIEKIGRLRIRDCNPVESAGRLRVPVLVIHGLADRHVRSAYGRELAGRMNGQCELWMVPGASHSRCREVLGRDYSRRVAGFLDKWLKDRPAESAEPHRIEAAARRAQAAPRRAEIEADRADTGAHGMPAPVPVAVRAAE